MLWNPLHKFFNLERKFSRIHQKTAHSYCNTFLLFSYIWSPGMNHASWDAENTIVWVWWCVCMFVLQSGPGSGARFIVRDDTAQWAMAATAGTRHRHELMGPPPPTQTPHHGLCPLIFSAVFTIQIKLDCVFLNSLGISDLMTVPWIPNLYSVTCKRRTSEIVR